MAIALQELPNDVIDGRLHFLNAWNIVGTDYHRKVRDVPAQNFAAVIAEQSNGQQIAFARFFQRQDDIPRSAAGGDRDGNIFGTRVSDQLAQKDIFRSHVVGESGDVGWLERE